MNLQRDRAAWLQGPDAVCQEQPAHPVHRRRLVLLGAPGVGKGTQAALLSAAFGACHLSTGDVFRAAHHAREGTPLSPAMRDAVDRMHRGELVPDGLVLDLVRERAACLRCRAGFLLDGFPRTVAQAEALDALLTELGTALDAVISYELPEAEIVARIGGRRTCPVCKAVYHLTARPPRRAGCCDACGTELIQRPDDAPAAVHVRQSAYETNTAPLRDHYAARGVLVSVAAHGAPEEIFQRTLAALG